MVRNGGVLGVYSNKMCVSSHKTVVMCEETIFLGGGQVYRLRALK